MLYFILKIIDRKTNRQTPVKGSLNPFEIQPKINFKPHFKGILKAFQTPFKPPWTSTKIVPKSGPGGLLEPPGAPMPPKSAKERSQMRPKKTQERPKSAPGAPQTRPRAPQDGQQLAQEAPKGALRGQNRSKVAAWKGKNVFG